MLSIASTFGSYFFSSCSVDYLNNESANKFSSYDEKINFRRKRNVSSSSKDDKININNDHDKILNESDDSHDINKNLDNLEYATQNNNKGNIYEEEHIGINNEKEKNIDHHQEVQSKDSHDNQNEHEQNYMKSNENTLPNDHEKSNENALPNDHEKSNENALPNDHEKSNENAFPYDNMKLDKDEYPNPPIKSHEQDCCSDKSFDECARKKELELNNNKKNYDIYNENAEESNNYSSPYNEKKYRLIGDFSRYMSVTINEKKGGLHNNCTTVLVDVDLFPNVSENYLSKMFDYLTNFKDEEINKNE
ncbi:hypothetical protein PFNF135_02748 [Plasmodium falciparum NF135/5.C10]|uniref:Uncharacterized protein n=1 Tax=Plasmodium falciparum NF135/5.C10 TaxID=1036726 RepID=W4IIH5_PLAFA|nr:hypothetical protein PFNF135_02748 [Plasmodium falciparum NF135/5.C10]